MRKYIALLLVLFVLYFIFNTLYDAGAFKTINNYSQLENIKAYQGIYGPEDLDIDNKNALLFISASDRWKVNAGIQSDDAIYLLDLKKDTIPYKLVTTFRDEFHPHGISYFQDNNEDYLFVINHNKTGNSIELFSFLNDTLFHLRSFKDDLLISPNDIVAIGINSFYVTIDHGSNGVFMRLMEDYLRLPLSYLVYFDGKEFTKVYEGLNYANGITTSQDGSTIYVTETTTGKLSSLKRNKETGELKLQFIKELKTGLDNITIDANGDLWIAAHPKLLDFVSHSKDSTQYSSSQVLKLRPIRNTGFLVDEIYLDNGKEISGSSTALFYNGQVYIGQVFNDKILRGNYSAID